MLPLKFSMPLNLTSRGKEIPPTHETKIVAVRVYSIFVSRSRNLTTHREVSLFQCAPRHSTDDKIWDLSTNLSTVSSIYCKISGWSASTFDQFGFRLKLKEYKCVGISQPLIEGQILVTRKSLEGADSPSWIRIDPPSSPRTI
jgi:hypothetical protein